MCKQAKIKIYRTFVRPVLTYTLETTADIGRTSQRTFQRKTGVRIVKNKSDNSLIDRKRKKTVKDESQVMDRWGRQHRRL